MYHYFADIKQINNQIDTWLFLINEYFKIQYPPATQMSKRRIFHT